MVCVALWSGEPEVVQVIEVVPGIPGKSGASEDYEPAPYYHSRVEATWRRHGAGVLNLRPTVRG
jgi:hypothetical protein